MTQIPDRSVDAVICDPPYGTTQCDWDKPLNLDATWRQFERVVKPHAVILMFSAQPFTSLLIQRWLSMYRYLWYWQKEKGTNFFRIRYQPLRVIEEVVVFANGTNYTYHPQMVPLDRPYRHTLPLRHSAITGDGLISDQSEAREYRIYTHAHPTNLLTFARDNANRGEVPTQKPVALLRYLIETYTDEGATILDPTMGAGSTGVAAVQCNRQFIGIELQESHYDIAKRRIDEASLITFSC